VIGGFEIAWIVKNVVFRQQGFVGKANQFAVVIDLAQLKSRRPIFVLIWADSSDDRSILLLGLFV
jgi:hypothetical protein